MVIKIEIRGIAVISCENRGIPVNRRFLKEFLNLFEKIIMRILYPKG